MQSQLAALAIISGFVLARLAERRYHSRNFGYLTVSGGEELIPTVMRRYYTMQGVALAFAYLEWVARGQSFPHPSLQTLAFLCVGIGFGLKLWAIQSLGRMWTMRCLFVPGLPRVRTGPYRFLSHPEYFGRFLEGLGICLFFDAWVTLLFYLYVTTRFMIQIVRTERRQLQELAEPGTPSAAEAAR